MARTTKSGPIRSTGGFEVGSGATNTPVISSAGEVLNLVAKTDAKVVLGIEDVTFSGGTWTRTRIAASNYSMDKTAAADTTYISADITELLRVAASKGLRLKSFDLAYSIGTADLTSHSRAVSSVAYVNNAAVAVAAHGGALSGDLAVVVQANPYLTVVTLGTPIFFVTDDAKINIELTIVAAATSVYKFYALILNFDHNYL